jgi:hypothetical protein
LNNLAFQPQALLAHLEQVVVKYNENQIVKEPPISSHSEHQPQFIPFDKMVEQGIPTLQHILDLEKVLKNEEFVDALQDLNLVYQFNNLE